MTRKKTALVCGDIVIDRIDYERPPHDSSATGTSQRWHQYSSHGSFTIRGGPWLVASHLQSLNPNAKVLQPPATPKGKHHKCVHSYAEIERFEDSVWRVSRFQGYSGPDKIDATPFKILNDPDAADLVVIDDAGNGFSEDPHLWPKSVRNPKNTPLVIWKCSNPFETTKLSCQLLKQSGKEDIKLVLILDANDLRSSGMKLSRHLSWERAATDLVYALKYNIPAEFDHISIVVRFGLDGAVVLEKDDKELVSELIYDPLGIEDDYRQSFSGMMFGYSSVFTSSLASSLLKGGLDRESLSAAVPSALSSVRCLHEKGFGPEDDPTPEQMLAPKSTESSPFGVVNIPLPARKADVLPATWRIAREYGSFELMKIARDIVLNSFSEDRGQLDRDLRDLPRFVTGKLLTVDRTEIERFRSARNLISEYIRRDSNRPLNIAVFGPPGSGKSFAVKQIAKGIASNVRTVPLTFNLAQFQGLDDLTKAMHLVHDHSIAGTVPLVFFDEFDCDFNGRELGWLKYFLEPMQDGSFRDGESLHPIGKAIFIFAGGTCATHSEFTGREHENPTDFRACKGPDFLSRLRGYIDILGTDRIDLSDDAFVLRRALALRATLRSSMSNSITRLVDNNGRLKMMPGLLQAFLRIPHLHHGVRSISAIIDMCLLTLGKGYEQASLPLDKQLELHVDPEEFRGLMQMLNLLEEEVGKVTVREQLAKRLHDEFRKNNKENIEDRETDKAWSRLADTYKEANLALVDHIPEKLLAVRCSFRARMSKSKEPCTFVLSANEIDLLAEMEHIRWVEERRNDGWTYGTPRDNVLKAHPSMIPWEQLPQPERMKDRSIVIMMPEELWRCGLEVFRLDAIPKSEIERHSVDMSVRAVISDSEGRLLLLKRRPESRHYAGLWEFPGGTMAWPETVEETLQREVIEETGLTIEPGQVVGTSQFEMDGRRLYGLYIKSQQKSLPGNVNISHEHVEARWITPKDIHTRDLTPCLEFILEHTDLAG